MIIGIVGSEGAKFTPETEKEARRIIHAILLDVGPTGMSSGACHLGGIDVWAEEIAKSLNIPTFIYPPVVRSWELGYKPRNIQIAKKSDVVHCITLKTLPESYKGMRFESCYHCNSRDHVKSGGCWTVKYAQKLGKPGFWHVI